MNWRTIVFLCLGIGLVVVFLPSLINNYREFNLLREQEEAGRLELQKYREHYTALFQEKQELENNPESVELLARDKLGYAREDEVIYIFPATPLPDSTP